uniref:Autophagy-related protein 2 n=1 Tax=Steinernema glaseri TaxID=37863 RepID=A0A1I7YZ34_9BILA
MAALQESLVGFLINRYLGDLFVGKCEIDNLKVKFTEGYASVSELRLNTEYINENLEKNGINLQLMEGYIGKLTVIVPFTSILEKSSEFVMDDVALSFQPRNSGPVGAINDIVSSMIGSMATSRELANEFFASEPVQQKDAGVESCEQLIAAVMSRIVFKVTNVMLRIETSSPDSDFCTAIECHIDSAKFVDEQLEACENQSRELRTITSEPKSIFSIASLNKLLHLTGVKFYTDITSKDDPTMSMSQQYTSIYQRRERERNKSKCSSSRTTEEFEFDFAQSMEATTDSFQSCYSHISTDDSVPKHVGSRETECLRSNPLKFGHLIGDDNVVKFSTTNSAVNAHPESTPKSIDIELNFQGLELFMNPSQMFIVKQIMDLILMPKEAASEEDSAAEGGRPMSKDDFRNIATMQNNTQFQSDPVRTAHGNLAGGQWAGTDTFQMTVRNREEEIMDDEFDTVNLASLNNERIRRLGSSVSSESSYETRTLCDSDKADTTRLRANIASFVMIVPHKDPWSIDAVKQNAKNGHMPLMEAQEEAVEEAREHSEKFFSAAADIRVKGVLDLKSLRTKFSNLYPADHLLITGWPFNIDLTLTKEPQNERTEIVATASQLDCCEFLMASSIHGSAKSAHFDIFSFDGICETNNANLILKVDASSGKDVRNNVILALGECSTELDISIIDRLSNFIAPNPFFAEKKSSPIQADDLHLSEDPWDNSENVAKQLNFELRMPSWTVNFRIPKADLRSAESSNRLSYCVKNVHPEILQLKFEKVNLKLPRLNTENLSRLWEMKLTCSSLTGAFKGDLSEPSKVTCRY